MNNAMSPEFVHLSDIVPRPSFFQSWERMRHRSVHWFVECAAEFGGVFCYTFFGVGATAAYTIGNILGLPLGSFFTVGFGYAIGIVLAVTLFAPTSGGHLNPCFTLGYAAFKGFPWRKVPRYIISQILGGYIATLLVYLQWKQLFMEAEAALAAKGPAGEALMFTPSGPAGVIALYVAPGTNLGFVLVNEFVVDMILAMTVWAVLDPTNFFAPPFLSQWVVGFAYGAAIWGFGPVGLAANAARDVGGRLAAMSIWGTQAAGGSYAALAALTNILATFVAATVYEFLFTDSSRVLPPAQVSFLRGHQAHLALKERGVYAQGSRPASHTTEEDKHEVRHA